MIVAVTVAGSAASLAALGYLAATDPKRRRAFRLPPIAARHPGLAWAAVVAPGAAVAWLAGGGGFLVWFGAATVAGWGIAALRPQRAEGARRALAAAGGRLRHLVAALGRALDTGAARISGLLAAAGVPAPRSARVALLEARIAALEAELAGLRGAPADEDTDAVVVELPLPAGR